MRYILLLKESYDFYEHCKLQTELYVLRWI